MHALHLFYFLIVADRRVDLKVGAATVLQRLLEEKSACTIVSLNWSRELISNAISQIPSWEQIAIHSNSMELVNGVTNGRLVRWVLLSEWCHQNTTDKIVNQFCVHVDNIMIFLSYW